MDDLEMHLMWLKDWFGDEPNQRQRRDAIQYVLAHADEAYPRILADLETKPFAVDAAPLIEVLPLFGREDSVGFLDKLLGSGKDRVCRTAGDALGRHPSKLAFTALLAGLASENRETRIGAAIGLGVRQDRAACPDLVERLGGRDSAERYHVVRALLLIGCGDETIWDDLAEDPDPDIRALAHKRRRPKS